MYNESFLIVNLKNDYSIIAYKKKEDVGRYNVELKLLKNSNAKTNIILDIENLIFFSTKRYIDKDITDYINGLMVNYVGYIYIQKYEHIKRCLQLGSLLKE